MENIIGKCGDEVQMLEHYFGIYIGEAVTSVLGLSDQFEFKLLTLHGLPGVPSTFTCLQCLGRDPLSP